MAAHVGILIPLKILIVAPRLHRRALALAFVLAMLAYALFMLLTRKLDVRSAARDAFYALLAGTLLGAPIAIAEWFGLRMLCCGCSSRAWARPAD
jgi:ABC-type enterochelin transport system permease subunit